MCQDAYQLGQCYLLSHGLQRVQLNSSFDHKLQGNQVVIRPAKWEKSCGAVCLTQAYSKSSVV